MKNLKNILRNSKEREEIEERIAAQKYYKMVKNGTRKLYNDGKPIVKNKTEEKDSFTKTLRNEKGYAERLSKKHFGI